MVPDSPLLFPNMGGNKIVNLFRRVSGVAEKYGIVLPTTRVVRAVVEVKATCLPPDKKQAIARTLSHSDQTAEEHYRALERNKSVLGYQSVGEILGDPVVKGEPTSGASPPPPPPSQAKGLYTSADLAEFSTLIERKKELLDKQATQSFWYPIRRNFRTGKSTISTTRYGT